jgi:hypothetical protein
VIHSSTKMVECPLPSIAPVEKFVVVESQTTFPREKAAGATTSQLPTVDHVCNQPPQHKAEIRSIAEYTVAKVIRKPKIDLSPDYPVTDEEMVVWVELLYEAFRNMVDVEDRDLKRAQNIALGHSVKEVELMCWDLLVGTVANSLFQGSAIQPFHF